MNNTLQDLGKVAYLNKGQYNASTNYEINDVVSFNGSSYVSLVNENRGNLPTNTNYWSVVAQKGDKGDTGKAFVIEKTYASIQEMIADYDNMQVNDYVMIQGSIEDEENATLWVKTDTEVSPYKWVYLADFSGASGITGATPNIQIGTVQSGNTPSVTRRGTNENPILDFVLKTGDRGPTGATGNGISSVEKTGTSGLIDTYKINYTNGTDSSFQVNNGKGISSINKTSTSGLVDTYTITYNDGTTSTFEITNGEDGEVTQAQLDKTNTELASLRTVFNALPKASYEDTNITLDDTANVVFDELTVKGNTSQETTTGKNLVESYIARNTLQQYQTVLYIEANLQPSTQYTVSFEGTVGNTLYLNETLLDQITFTVQSGRTIVTSTTKSEISRENSQQYIDNYGWIIFKNYTDGVSTANVFNNLQLEQGTATDYEPYTGGQPSPSPDFPQEVKVVKGQNTLKVEGKNLVKSKNVDSALTQYQTVLYIDADLQPSTEYTLSFEGTAGNNLYLNETLFEQVIFIVASGRTTITSTTKAEISKSNNNQYGTDGWKIIKNYTGGVSTANVFDNLQLEKGSATDYEPYKSQSYEVNLGNLELCKIVDYQDYIYHNKSNNKWYKHTTIAKNDIKNSLNSISFNTISGDYAQFLTPVLSETCLTLSNNSSSSNYLKSNITNNFYGTTGLNKLRFNISLDLLGTTSSSSSSEQTTALLNKLNLLDEVLIYYPLATPTDEEITDVTLIGQLEAIYNAVSYQEQTNITSEYEEGNAQMIIKASAIKDLNIILSDLNNAIIEIGGGE